MVEAILFTGLFRCGLWIAFTHLIRSYSMFSPSRTNSQISANSNTMAACTANLVCRLRISQSLN